MILLNKITGSFKQNLTAECNYIYKFIDDVYHKSLSGSYEQQPFFCLNLGRRAGHTTAIKHFVRDNPDLKICILVLSFRSDNYEEFKVNSNVSVINYSNTDALRGKIFDYLIVDSCPSTPDLDYYRFAYKIPTVFVGGCTF